MKKEDFIKLGLGEELATKCEQASTDELKGFIPKARFDEVNSENKTLKTDISARDKQLEDLKKAGSVEDLQAEIARLQNENQTAKDNYEKDLYNTRLNNEIDKALMSAKAKDLKVVKAAFNLDNVKYEDGNLIGFEEQLKNIRESHSYLFDAEEKPSGTGGSMGNKGKQSKEVDPFLKGMGLV